MSRNKNSVFSTLGSTAHGLEPREEHDFYRTDPIAAECLLQLMRDEFDGVQRIWECACGDGALAKVFTAHGYRVVATDLIDRGYGVPDIDFLQVDKPPAVDAIITNPPFNRAEDFVRQALRFTQDGGYVCMFLRTLFLEGKARKKLFDENPPKYVFVSSARINCAKPSFTGNSSAMSFSWFVWQKGFVGDTIVKWFDKADYELPNENIEYN